MIELELMKSFAIALILGLLIGLEREYARYRQRGHDYAGIRTFPLITLFGTLCAYLGTTLNSWILIVGIILVGILILISYFTVSYASRKFIGATSEIAGFLAFFIGVLCYFNEFRLAITLTVVITIILYSRSVLHHFAEHIKRRELSDTIKFALIAFVILPFLPNQGYGPYGLFNPFTIWLMVVFISGISFACYILMKWLGEKGLILTGILSGMVDSIMATSTLAERSIKEHFNHRSLALATIAANGVMFLRILAVVLVLNPALFVKLLLPMLIPTAVTAGFCYFLFRKNGRHQEKIIMGSPFTLKPALKFAFFFALILALIKLADIYFSTRGVYIISFLSGFTNIDAITISLSQLAAKDLTENTARNALIIAATSSMALKAGISYFFGSREFSRIVVAFNVVLILLSIVMLLLF